MKLELAKTFPFAHVLRGHRFGPGDPSTLCRDDLFEKAVWTPEGAGLLRLSFEDGLVRAQAHGPGRDWLLPWVPAILGGQDEPGDFHPGPLADRYRPWREFRLSRAPWLSATLVKVVLQQRVSWRDASRAFAGLVRRHGGPAPGSSRVLLPPSFRTIHRLGAAEFAAVGVENKRAATLREVGFRASRLDRLDGAQAVAAALDAIPGVGVWTRENTLGFALGCTDVVPLGDYDLPNSVAFALAGEARADDQRMLELLEPYRGHRFRILRLLMLAGITAPRRGPRMAPSQALGQEGSRPRRTSSR
ncbi:MAG: DNA-3-methyladenine glycosylase [Vulcanimicrobiota bacterium]